MAKTIIAKTSQGKAQPAKKPPAAITFDQIVGGFKGDQPFAVYVHRLFKEHGISPTLTPNFNELNPAVQWLCRATMRTFHNPKLSPSLPRVIPGTVKLCESLRQSRRASRWTNFAFRLFGS
jgi:hypothetical protein